MTPPQSILAADSAVFQTGREEGSPKGKRDGVHQFGIPPKGTANFGWVQPFSHHLAPQGMAGFALANGCMSCNQSGEKETWLPS